VANTSTTSRKIIEAHLHMTFKFPTDKSNSLQDSATYMEQVIANYLETKLGLVDVNIYNSQFIDNGEV
jgi:hypothetical protein